MLPEWLGELDGVRILGRKTVELMSSNHTGNLFVVNRPGYGFGLGVGGARRSWRVRTVGVGRNVPVGAGRSTRSRSSIRRRT